MTASLRKICTFAYAVLTPYRCRFCGNPLLNHDNPYLCHQCLAALPWIGDNACRHCGYPGGEYARQQYSCIRCRSRLESLSGAVAVVRYRGGARSLVKSLKFRGETGLIPPIAALMAERVKTAFFLPLVDIVIPVSLHIKRRRQRGFDQAVLLAEQIAETIERPILPHALVRVRATPSQASLRRAERLVNMDGAFSVEVPLKNAGVLLIDDVMTTGATMAECARACGQAGARRVYALTFAR